MNSSIMTEKMHTQKHMSCTHLKSVIMLSLIIEHVQIIYDIYYQSEQWDFLSKILYVSKKHKDCISLSNWHETEKSYVALRNCLVSRS